ncbi:MAG: hypothetical protein QOG53_201 [Frankiales bacterium]|jgi:hypothetical protein|nr:hypothetical protein [Frankiales bacterium]
MQRRVIALSIAVAASVVGVSGHALDRAGAASAVSAPIANVASATDIGPMKQHPAIRGRDNVRSALFGGTSFWAFADTMLGTGGSDGDNWADNSISWTKDLDASNGVGSWADRVDSTGTPTEFLPLTESERSFNQAHAGNSCQVKPCNAEYALWPGEITADRANNRLLMFYVKIYRVTGQSNWTTIGVGIATWRPGNPVTRPTLSPGTAEPTLMFGPNDPGFGNGATVIGSTLHVYGCWVEWIAMRCGLARVPIASALVRASWRYYAGGTRWTSSPDDAVAVFDGGAAGTSVQWNNYVGAYVAIYSQPFSDDVMYRTSPTLWGPWSTAALLFHGKPGWDGNFDYAAATHPEYATGNGQTQFVTYVRTTGFLQQEARQVRVVFAKP